MGGGHGNATTERVVVSSSLLTEFDHKSRNRVAHPLNSGDEEADGASGAGIVSRESLGVWNQRQERDKEGGKREKR